MCTAHVLFRAGELVYAAVVDLALLPANPGPDCCCCIPVHSSHCCHLTYSLLLSSATALPTFCLSAPPLPQLALHTFIFPSHSITAGMLQLPNHHEALRTCQDLSVKEEPSECASSHLLYRGFSPQKHTDPARVSE